MLGSIGARLNVAAERLRNQFDRADGDRQFASLALATQPSAQTSLSADFEYHRKSQPSVPGPACWIVTVMASATHLPAPVNPAVNPNNQSWAVPGEGHDGRTLLKHRFNADWSARVAANVQQSRINDRLAFPDGCSNAPTHVILASAPTAMSMCMTSVAKAKAQGGKLGRIGCRRFNGAYAMTRVSACLAAAKCNDLPRRRPTTTSAAPTSSPWSPLLADPSHRTQHQQSRARGGGYASLQSDLARKCSRLPACVSRLHRASERSDGSRAVAYDQTVTTPWAGLARSPSSATMLYASWGQGAELKRCRTGRRAL